MADTPKRKKLEKNIEITPPSNQKFICCRCGTAYGRQKGYFPVSHSPMYRGSGYLPICNDCIETVYEQYRSKLADDREAMRRIWCLLLKFVESVAKSMQPVVVQIDAQMCFVGRRLPVRLNVEQNISRESTNRVTPKPNLQQC